MVTPQQPFSTILAMKIIQIIREHDLEISDLTIRARDIPSGEMATQLQQIDSRLADAVFDAVRTNLATLESVVDRVLQIEDQMRLLRNA